jgi:hypothetical protein
MRWIAVFVSSVFLMALPAHASHRGASATMTIRLISTATDGGWLHDGEPQGDLNKGEVFWIKSTLRNAIPQFNRPKGAIVGSDVTTIKVVSTSPAIDDATLVTKLPAGTLRGAGRVRETKTQVMPVTGGTGKFAGARGTLESTSLDANGDRSLNVYRLRLP